MLSPAIIRMCKQLSVDYSVDGVSGLDVPVVPEFLRQWQADTARWGQGRSAGLFPITCQQNAVSKVKSIKINLLASPASSTLINLVSNSVTEFESGAVLGAR